MRSFLDPRGGGRSGRRTEKLKEKYRSRFKDGALRSGSRDLQRFRRTRELIAREMTVFILWLAIAFMLIPLGRSLWRVAQAHLADRPVVLQVALPALPALALVFCVFRARSSWAELGALRQDQREILRRLREEEGSRD
jgi:hypothetical protein